MTDFRDSSWYLVLVIIVSAIIAYYAWDYAILLFIALVAAYYLWKVIKSMFFALIMLVCAAVVIALFVIRFNSTSPPESMTGEDDQIYMTPQDEVDQIYSLLGSTIEVLDKNKVDYYIIAGTLLGAVRHKGMIPWDDDIDIMVNLDDMKKLKATKKDFEAKGLRFTSHEYNTKPDFKVWDPKSDKWQNGNKHTYPFVDIFISTRESDEMIPYYGGETPLLSKLLRLSSLEKAKKQKTLRLKHKDIYPLKEYEFGPYMVKGPNNPDAYLVQAFGEDWKDKAIQTHHHGKNFHKPRKQVIDLTKTKIDPALPTNKQPS